MNEWIDWFQRVLDVSIRLYFRQECDLSSVYDIPLPKAGPLWKALLPEQVDPTFDEWMVLMLALMPHLSPQMLDIFFVHNKNFDRPYTEFGGWKGLSHGGFLPTGETAVFLLAGDRVERRLEVVRLFREEHWFHMYHVVGLEGAGNGEPFLSGQLRISEDFLYRLSFEGEYKPDYNMGFPAKRISTALNWEDAVLPYYVREELEEINNWITGHRVILSDWGLSRFLKAGYRTLFYGPPGTGKTLCATLIGKKNGMDVYRIDLSMIVSKYIGETEKNLANVFDQAENRNWILFFDEATNSLDANNERAIVENLTDFYRGKTVIIVAHRLSTVRNADQIVVLDRGRIVEVGSHEELIKRNGAYYNLVKNQLELGN